MAKVETFLCAMTWLLMNALVVLVAIEPGGAYPAEPAALVADAHSAAGTQRA